MSLSHQESLVNFLSASFTPSAAPSDFSELLSLLLSYHSLCFKHKVVLLTGSGSLADKSNELLFYFLHSIQIIHKEDVSVAGLTGDIHQLPVVCVSKANGKDDVALEWNWTRELLPSYEVDGKEMLHIVGGVDAFQTNKPTS